jgi:Spy/CpxP family protein refolding chaperone
MKHWNSGKTRAFVATIVVVLSVGVAMAGVAAQQEAQGRQGHRPAFAGRWFGPGPRAMAAGMVLRGLRALNLTEAQRESIRGVMQAHRDEFKVIARNAIAARTALNDAVTADTIDREAIRAAAGRVAEVELSAALLRAQVHGEVLALLTAEQQQKARAMREKVKSRITGAIERRLGL